jgi:two-component system sporulation sensor kinase A
MTGPVAPRVTYERVDRLFTQILTFITQEAARCQVQIKTDFAVELPCCLVDARQLKQVFLNLCKNALEAMPTGGTLMVRIQPTIGHEQIVIEVTDTGVGIPAQDLDRIWKPFYSTKADGRGLGLSVCRRVLEQQGGHIHVANPNAGGTTFRLTLPAARTES